MKPKTILQKKVAELSLSLPKITDKQRDYAFMKYFNKYAVLSRKSLYCLECGHKWPHSGQDKFCVCPECGNILELSKHYNGSLFDSYYYSIITTHKGMQVVRIFYVRQYMRKKQKVSYSLQEVMQHWIDERGRIASMTIGKTSYNWNGVQWSFGSPMEVRSTSFCRGEIFKLETAITYPRIKVLDVIKRNGFRGTLKGIRPQLLFHAILTDKHCETLLKTGQIDLLKSCVCYPDRIAEVWPSIKICIRNNYVVQKASDWMDYIRLLQFFGKDLLNSKYVCPDNLKEAHDKYVAKKRRADEKRRMEERMKRLIEDQLEYEEKRKKFAGFKIEGNGIEIKFLETVEEFMNEGNALGHCVFTNEYYKKKDSLIMSARIDEKPVETVEVSLTQMKVIQARGKGNMATKHHKVIVAMVNDNMKLIRKRLKQKIAV